MMALLDAVQTRLVGMEDYFTGELKSVNCLLTSTFTAVEKFVEASEQHQKVQGENMLELIGIMKKGQKHTGKRSREEEKEKEKEEEDDDITECDEPPPSGIPLRSVELSHRPAILLPVKKRGKKE